MARTQEQILAQINEEADRHAALAELQRHTSRISVWRHIKQSAAFAIRTIEEMLDTHSAEVESRLNRQRIGTRAWYAEQALRYQHGQKVALIDGRPGYATDAAEARIIRHLAVEEATDDDGNKTGIIKVKAVKAGETPGAPYEVLTEEEKQLLPPPWRDCWRFRVLHALLLPLERTLRSFADKRALTREKLQLSMQVFSLQAVLSKTMRAPVRIEHRAANPLRFVVRIHRPEATSSEVVRRKAEIRQLLLAHKLAGTSFTIEDVQESA